MDCVSPAVEDKIIRETCWTKLVTAERVTVTEREKLNGVTETCTRHVETREIIKKTMEIKTPETREIEKVEKRLHDKDGVKDEHTHTELARDHEGELGECLVTRCEQLDSLLMERGEGVCPLEAIHDQVGQVELCGVGGMSEANGYTRSLGGIETPEPLVVARIPSVSVPVCVYTSVAKSVAEKHA